MSEPLMTCRNKFQWRRNRGKIWAPGQVWGEPADCPDGVRHVGGASLVRALARNVGTCRPDTARPARAGGERECPKRTTPRGAEYRRGARGRTVS